MGVGSAGVALVGGGSGVLIIAPKTGTLGWMPRIGGEITLVDGALVGGGLAGGVKLKPKTTTGRSGWTALVAGEGALVDG